jgi:hypothetical protein
VELVDRPRTHARHAMTAPCLRRCRRSERWHRCARWCSAGDVLRVCLFCRVASAGAA